MVDWWIVLFLGIMTVVLLVANLYVLVEFQHVDDKNQAYLPKFLVIFGLLLIEITILLFPLDVQNQGGGVGCDQGWNDNCGNLDMHLAWSIMYCMIAIMVIVVMPFAIFYYEADDGLDPSKSPACNAASYTTCTLVISLVVLLCMFFLLGETEIPVESYETTLSSFQDVSVTTACASLGLPSCTSASDDLVNVGGSSETVVLTVSFPVYVMALMAFVGWWFFTVFAGVGMASLPVDLIMSFVYRPKRLDKKRFELEEKGIMKRSADLIEIAQLMKKERQDFSRGSHSMFERRKRRQQDTVTLNKFKQMVYILEQDYEDLKLCYHNHKNFNPLMPYVRLALGILAAVLSILWILQIILFILVDPPATGFLNEYFEFFDSWLSSAASRLACASSAARSIR